MKAERYYLGQIGVQFVRGGRAGREFISRLGSTGRAGERLCLALEDNTLARSRRPFRTGDEVWLPVGMLWRHRSTQYERFRTRK